MKNTIAETKNNIAVAKEKVSFSGLISAMFVIACVAVGYYTIMIKAMEAATRLIDRIFYKKENLSTDEMEADQSEN